MVSFLCSFACHQATSGSTTRRGRTPRWSPATPWAKAVVSGRAAHQTAPEADHAF